MSDMQRETLFRSATFQLRDDGDGGMPTMWINFARANEWTEINDLFEGRFLEQFADSAFKKTLKERMDRIRSLFQHGQDPQVGKKVLGPVEDVEKRADGWWGKVPLLDTDYNRELVPGLKAGLYGASMAFRPTRVERNDDPGVSEHNPLGLPEVTVTEAELREFGPVTFPAYENTSAGVRSLTSDLIIERISREPEAVRQVLSRQIAENQRHLAALTETHGSEIVAAVVAAVNGDIGGAVGLGFQRSDTPSTETKERDEQAPADEATPAVRLVRVGDSYLPLKAA